MSLTSVFGMGTGGPSPQSIPTLTGWLLTILYIMLILRTVPLSDAQTRFLNVPTHSSFFILHVLARFILLVTHTGFEPMLTA